MEPPPPSLPDPLDPLPDPLPESLTEPLPEPAPRPRDPLAVAVANASLLGIGYLLLGRRLLAGVTLLITATLVILLSTVARSIWQELALVLWWAAHIANGWRLAGGRPEWKTVRRQRVAASAVTIPVLLSLILLRIQTAGIEDSVSNARDNGDCGVALTALEQIWLGDRIANAPGTAQLDLTTQACHRLQTAKNLLTTAWTGNIDALRLGFTDLAAVLAQLPGHEKMVQTVLDWFLNGLSRATACDTAAITDWLGRRHPTHNELDTATAVIPRSAPKALVDCADSLMTGSDWAAAQSRYQQLLDQYPGNALAARAQQGVHQATLAIQLDNVRGLLTGSTGTQPAYCSAPAAYGGAPAYGRGVNPAMIYGNDDYANRLPADWKTSDAATAALVVCAGAEQFGDTVQTCAYYNENNPEITSNVAFHKIAIPVKGYELRTGKLVFDTTVQINGASCPDSFDFFAYGPDDPGPADRYVAASDNDVQAAFAALIAP